MMSIERRFFIQGLLASGAALYLNLANTQKLLAFFPEEDDKVINLPRKDKDPFPLAPVYTHGDRSLPYVALVFDDGWDFSYVEKIAEEAEERGILITCFINNNVLSRHQDFWREYLLKGNEIQNHTATHQKLTELSDERVLKEIDDFQAVYEKVMEGIPHPRLRYLRPPWGAGFEVEEKPDKRLTALIAQRGLEVVLWDTNSGSTEKGTSAEKAFYKTTSVIQNGSITLFHFVKEDFEAFPKVLDFLQSQSLTPVTLTELFNPYLLKRRTIKDRLLK